VGDISRSSKKSCPTVTTIIDLVQSSKKILDQYHIKYDSRIFLWGFSQGGHAILSVLKEIEEQDKHGIKITAAASAGGPYKCKRSINRIFPKGVSYVILNLH
jgi:predicted peptidase